MLKNNKVMKNTKDYILTVIKWVLLSLIVGVACAVVGVGFHFAVDEVTLFRQNNPYILYFLPLGGILIALLYKAAKIEGVGTDKVIDAVKGENPVPLLLVPVIFVSTVITHLLGGSAGREGAALQLGGGIADGIGKIFRLNEKEMHIIT